MVQYDDLDYSEVRVPRAMSGLKKKAIAATLIAVACVAVVSMMVSEAPLPKPSELEEPLDTFVSSAIDRAQRASRLGGPKMALRQQARTTKMARSQKLDADKFKLLQSKIESDLGMDQVESRKSLRHRMAAPRQALSALHAPKSAQDLLLRRSQVNKNWYPPRFDEGEDAQASATLSAARAQDALHHIQQIEDRTQRSASHVSDHLNDVAGARDEIERELNEVYDATQTAQEALAHATAIQQEAAEALSDAREVKNEEEARAEHVADVESKVQQEGEEMEQLLTQAEHTGAYVAHVGHAALFAHNAAQAIQNYLQDSFTMANAVSKTSKGVRAQLQEDLESASSSVNALSQDEEDGAHATQASQHYARAARLFALHAAGAAKGAINAVDGAVQAQEASMQAAFQAVQAAKGAQYAHLTAIQAREGAAAASRMANHALYHCVNYYSSSLPGDDYPVKRAEALVDHMAPILSKAADDLEAAQGDCTRLTNVVDEMRSELTPVNAEGKAQAKQLTPVELHEVQSYAQQALGSTLERLMLEMMKTVQACGPSVIRSAEEHYSEPTGYDNTAEDNEEDSSYDNNNESYSGDNEDYNSEESYGDDSTYNPDEYSEQGGEAAQEHESESKNDDLIANQPYDGGARAADSEYDNQEYDYDNGHDDAETAGGVSFKPDADNRGESPDVDFASGEEASLQVAKQLVDSRAEVIDNMIDSIRANLAQGDCKKVREVTMQSREDFNYFERQEMQVMQSMKPDNIENVDQYAQFKLMPLLQTSLREFDKVKASCGREVFSDMPDVDEHHVPTGGMISEGADESESEGKKDDEEKSKSPETALTISARSAIDHMVKGVKDLIEAISVDPTDCHTAEAAGTAFKAKFSALERIAENYEDRMTDAEKAVTEQYAEDNLGGVMQDLFSIVMQTTAHCGQKAFDFAGAHTVEDFYEDEAKRTMEERGEGGSNDNMVEPEGDYQEDLPHGEPNPEAETSVNDMKERVEYLKKKLEGLRKKFSGSSSSSGSGSKASGSKASGAASGGSKGSAAASGSKAASAAGSAAGSK